MQNAMLIGIDLGKHSFHIHWQGRQGHALLRKIFCIRSFSRFQLATFLATYPICALVMESCASAYYMARTVSLLGH
ncbi:transposase family protein [Yersinia ruckeri]|nr:transposase family protein [Yersinia ruckeri]